VKKTMEALTDTSAYASFAAQVLKEKWVRPNTRIFDNSKISDHFAIIPTLVQPKHLNELEAKLYDFVVKRFLAAFYPPAEFMVTTRITRVVDSRSVEEGGAGNRGWPPSTAGSAARRGTGRTGEARHEGNARTRQARRARRHGEDRCRREHDAPATALDRGDAPLGDGRRRQAYR
jgi:DNA topoisomerase-3